MGLCADSGECYWTLLHPGAMCVVSGPKLLRVKS